ncbi:hypothetical protein GCM10025879_05600 [Leuconostoc litchii]|nr:hypothetical protein GCM10025879_05600 [Leuconostoc litchii]
MLVEYLNKHDLDYSSVLDKFHIPNENKILSADELEKVSQTGFEFEKETGLSGNTGHL